MAKLFSVLFVTLCFLLRRQVDVLSAYTYTLLEDEVSHHDATDTCTLATPPVQLTEEGFTVDLKDMNTRIDKDVKVLTGYTQTYHSFQYSGCNVLGSAPVMMEFMTSDAIGVCYSACSTTYIGIGRRNNKRVCFCMDKFNWLYANSGCDDVCGLFLCGGDGVMSVYQHRGESDAQSIDEHTVCLAYSLSVGGLIWKECSDSYEVVCADDGHVSKPPGWTFSHWSYTWRDTMMSCFKEDMFPATASNILHGNLFSDHWTGEIRSLVKTVNRHSATGYLVKQGGTFILKFGSPADSGRPLCERTIRSTTSVSTTNLTVNNATTPPTNPDSIQTERTIRSTTSVSTTSVTVNNTTTPSTHPDSTQTEHTTYVSTEAVGATINNETKPSTNADSTQTVTMYILYIIIALVLAVIISVGVICVIRWKMRKISHGGSTNQPENVNAVRLDEHVGDSTPLASSHQNRSSSRATNLEMGRMRLVELNDGMDDADNESPDDEPQQEGDGYEHAYSGLDRHRNDAGNEHTYAPMEVEPGPEGDSYVHMYSGLDRQRDEADNEHTYAPMQVEHEPDGDSYVHMYSGLNRQRVGSSTEHAYTAIHVQHQLETTIPEYLDLSAGLEPPT